jgi:hypothetical protein
MLQSGVFMDWYSNGKSDMSIFLSPTEWGSVREYILDDNICFQGNYYSMATDQVIQMSYYIRMQW